MLFLPVSFLEFKTFLVDLKLTQHISPLLIIGTRHPTDAPSGRKELSPSEVQSVVVGGQGSRRMKLLSHRVPFTGPLRALSPSLVRLTMTTENHIEKISNNRLYFNRQKNFPSPPVAD